MTTIGEKISVLVSFKNGLIIPKEFEWNGKIFKIEKVVLNYSKRLGNSIGRFFSVEVFGSASVYQISFNTENMLWKIEGVEDE